jgi:hypothetical protein
MLDFEVNGTFKMLCSTRLRTGMAVHIDQLDGLFHIGFAFLRSEIQSDGNPENDLNASKQQPANNKLRWRDEKSGTKVVWHD